MRREGFDRSVGCLSDERLCSLGGQCLSTISYAKICLNSSEAGELVAEAYKAVERPDELGGGLEPSKFSLDKKVKC